MVQRSPTPGVRMPGQCQARAAVESLGHHQPQQWGYLMMALVPKQATLRTNTFRFIAIFLTQLAPLCEHQLVVLTLM